MNVDTEKIVVQIIGILALIYLANMGAGVVELSPDNVPVFGNIDEVIATLVAWRALVGKELP